MLNQFDPGEPLTKEMVAIAAGAESFNRIFAVPQDPQVAAFEASGRSLLELSPATDAAAALSAWEIAG